jgi:hypothetical protein
MMMMMTLLSSPSLFLFVLTYLRTTQCDNNDNDNNAVTLDLTLLPRLAPVLL